MRRQPTHRMNQISVVINTYNAERHLREVIEAVKGFDEILVCDMESTDSTLTIAREMGCNIVTYPRGTVNIVEPAREFAIHQAMHEWVLVVDADEIVTPQLRTYLYERIQQDDAPAGIAIPRKNYFMGRFMHCHYPDYVIRFFRRDCTHWPPVIHCAPEIDGRIDHIPARRTELALEHRADDTVSLRLQKTDQYTDNELPKRAGKHYGTMALIFRPLLFWFKCYVSKGGWRDGKAGFIKAVLEGHYQFVMLAKLEERNNANQQKQ